MDEMRGFVCIVALLSCVALALITTCGVKADRETQAIARMVQAGAEPIAAKCSLQGAESRDPACIAQAMKSTCR